MMENMYGLSLDLIVHPGETIREIIEDKNMSQEELAIRTNYSAKHISEVLSGKKGISSKFANALEYALGISTEFWINLQGIYDKEIIELEKINEISEKEYSILEQLKEVVLYCYKINILNNISNKSINILNLRKFLNINDLASIPNLPIQQVAFRGSKCSKVNIYVLYAWQKLCEYFTEQNKINVDFNKELLKTKYDEIKSTMFLEPNEMILKLKKIFSECGIIFEVVRHFTGAPVQGFIKKKNNRVILCMTIRQSFSDIFWFTLFHEISHLLNEDFEDKYIDYSFIESEIESKADNFAMNTLINKDDYDKFIEKNVLNINSIKKFARAQGVLPGIVIGRIQNDTKDYSFLAKYKEKYVWE